ncbi:MAG: hypothetical protein JJU31_08535 [Wenzhouxiangella sp.]|nr:hypothetical protein [Wenzhouxiangella sp.]TVR94716.1 MAG: hypothetical protein EA418_09565 [Wenzhouxiangellaceae bacterium]
MLKVLDHPSGERQACLLHSSSFKITIEIHGIGPAELGSRINESGPRLDWRSLRDRGPVRLFLQQGAQESSAAPGEAWETDLADGLVRLHSAAHAEIRIGQQHVDTPALLPSSLYLALSQQWALAGLLPVHAAAIEIPGHGGILVIGRKGAGKSVLSAAALAAGAQVVSDDWVLVGQNEGLWMAERIRSFFMLRESWASNALLEKSPQQLPFASHRSRPRKVLKLDEQSCLTPSACRLDAIWLLERPSSGRRSSSTICPASPAAVLGQLIEASMPALFSRRLPKEHENLQALTQKIARKLEGYVIQTGTELVHEPDAALWRLWARSSPLFQLDRPPTG